LDSLKTEYEKRIVIIDNGSTDNTQREAMKLVGPDFHYERHDSNWGVQKAWNFGINDCFNNHSCHYVFVCNNDTLFHLKAIDNLVNRFQKKNCYHCKPEECSLLAMVTCNNIKSDCGDKPENIFDMALPAYEQTEESEHPDFSAFMINRKCWSDIGEFDEGFFPAYYEDNDYHRRINLAGMKAIVLPSAIYYHYGSKTQLEATDRRLVESAHGHTYFRRKWGDNPEPDGSLTSRLWEHPFNDLTKDVKWTTQLQKCLEIKT
jgi:GT2 family glycosyltransferase